MNEEPFGPIALVNRFKTYDDAIEEANRSLPQAEIDLAYVLQTGSFRNATDAETIAITYRIAVGPQAGRKVFTLQTLPACDPEELFGDTVGKVAGFSLHAGVAARAAMMCSQPINSPDSSKMQAAPSATSRSS